MQKGFATLLIIFSFTASASLTLPKDLKRLAFGSCNDQNQAQLLWAPILASAPDLFLWGGDTIYADWDEVYNIQASYQKQKDHPEYQQLLRAIPVLGIWDDHDYASDNADGTFPLKKESQKYFLDFLDEPANSPRRLQEGVYTSYNFGAANKKIKLILLDNRYFKNLEASAPMLGTTQWTWLENELKHSDASVHFIMAGLSIVSPLIPYSEEWANHGMELNRLLKLLETYKTKGVVFLTGDKHFASIFHGWGHLEFLSSGMTHVTARKTWWYLAHRYETTFFGLNYGLIDITWEGSTPSIAMAIKDRTNRSIHPRSFKWQQTKWVEQRQTTTLQ